MKDKNKTRVQLVGELADLRQRVTELETAKVERKRVEDKLEQSEEKYRNIVELAPDGIITVSLTGVATWCNSAFLELTGFSRNEIVGKHISRLPTLRLEDIPQYIKILFSAVRGKVLKPFEFIWVHKDGTSRWGEAHVGLLKKGSRITGLQLILRDTTERKQTEEALRESEERYRNFVVHSSEGIYRIDLVPPVPIDLNHKEFAARIEKQAVTSEVNEALAKMYGLSTEDMVDRPVTDFAPDYGLRAADLLHQDFHVSGIETLNLDKDGKPIHLSESFDAIVQDGSLVRIWGMQRDITERKQMEEHLRRHDRLAAVGQLSAGIAHDFRNLLTTIILYANLTLYKPDLPQDTTQNIETIISESKKAAHLVQQILDFSSRSMIQTQTINLENLIQDAIDILQRTIPENIRLRLEVSSARAFAGHLQSACMVKVDPNRIEQALMNLALNSRDAMPEGGELRFKLSKIQQRPGNEPPVAGMPPGKWVCLAVSDTGTGMTESVRAHLFEPFFTTKEVGKGTGLGLAQVYGIIRQHEGYIDVDTEVGKGTTFHIYLPSTRAEEESVEEKVSATLLRGQGERVLLVEDDENLREAGQSILESLGYQVLAAANGREALTIYEAESKPDLVITDIVMPEMGGKELVQELGRTNPNLKVLGITGYTTEQVAEELKAAGFLNVIRKPFDIEILAQVIRHALDAN